MEIGYRFRIWISIVAYIRRQLEGGGKIHVPFLMSEAHVASLAMLQDPVDGQQPLGDSVPRRGLCAANCGQIVG